MHNEIHNRGVANTSSLHDIWDFSVIREVLVVVRLLRDAPISDVLGVTTSGRMCNVSVLVTARRLKTLVERGFLAALLFFAVWLVSLISLSEASLVLGFLVGYSLCEKVFFC